MLCELCIRDPRELLILVFWGLACATELLSLSELSTPCHVPAPFWLALGLRNVAQGRVTQASDGGFIGRSFWLSGFPGNGRTAGHCLCALVGRISANKAGILDGGLGCRSGAAVAAAVCFWKLSLERFATASGDILGHCTYRRTKCYWPLVGEAMGATQHP